MFESDSPQTMIAGQPEGDRPPEGRLLLQVNGRVEILDTESGRSVIDRGAHGHDLTGTGRLAVETVEVVQRETGVSLHTQLRMTNTETGETKTVYRAAPRSTIGDPAFSPDGSRVAFTLASWRPTAVMNEEVAAQESLCILVWETGTNRCLRNLGTVWSFDWAPTGEKLLASGPGDVPVYIVDAASGDAEVLLPPGGTETVRAALDSQPGFGARADQFVRPEWSADGTLVATVASVTPGGWVPVVVDTDGELVALGRRNPHGQQAIAWSPVENALAHTTGYNGVGPPDVTFGIHVLDADSGETRLVHATSDKPMPAILGVEWSPSGRWVALDRAIYLDIVDVLGASAYTIDLHHDDPGDASETLQDWSG